MASAKKIATGILLLLALGAPRLAMAQGRDVSASFGYQYLSVNETDSQGVFADVAVAVAGPLALVGSVDWATHGSQAFGFDQSLTWLATSGGVRVGLGAQRIVPFGQMLVGAERDTLDIESFGSESSSHLLIQAGGGVAIRVVGRVSVVGQIDWRHVERDEDQDGVRFAVGARLRLN